MVAGGESDATVAVLWLTPVYQPHTSDASRWRSICSRCSPQVFHSIFLGFLTAYAESKVLAFLHLVLLDLVPSFLCPLPIIMTSFYESLSDIMCYVVAVFLPRTLALKAPRFSFSHIFFLERLLSCRYCSDYYIFNTFR
jgi:hypothetical protein